MNRLNIVKCYFNGKEKRVKISNSKIVSKNNSKFIVKTLALTLCAVTFFSEIVPSANAVVIKEGTKSENSIVKKIKDAGEYVGSLAKSGYTNAINWIKKHPKIATAVSTGVLLVIVATVGGLYYKSLKKNSDEAELKEKKKEPDVNAGVSAENLLKGVPESEKEISPEEKEKQMKSLLKKLKEQKLKEQREIYLNGSAEHFKKLSEDMKALVNERRKSLLAVKSTTDKIYECSKFIDVLVRDLKNGGLEKSISEYFGGEYSEYIDVLSGCKYKSDDSARLSSELKLLYDSLEKSCGVLRSNDVLITELSKKIQPGNGIVESK